jgi:hypothetical protein
MLKDKRGSSSSVTYKLPLFQGISIPHLIRVALFAPNDVPLARWGTAAPGVQAFGVEGGTLRPAMPAFFLMVHHDISCSSGQTP